MAMVAVMMLMMVATTTTVDVEGDFDHDDGFCRVHCMVNHSMDHCPVGRVSFSSFVCIPGALLRFAQQV